MPSSAERVLAVVRGQILRRERRPGDKISEVGVAAEMDVSRTPARTALAALAAEGLIEKREGRGFTIRSIPVADLANSIEVRSVLEGLAARTMAENGMTEQAEATLLKSISISQAVLDSEDPDTDFIGGYTEANQMFHETIMRDCGNDLIAYVFERIAMLPMTALGTLAFDKSIYVRERMRLTVGHSQHVILFDALKNRDGQRAEAMMREHSKATLNYTDLFVNKVYDQAAKRRRH